MKISLYQIDAFSPKLFQGNPAAVCPLDNWLDDRTLQAIAAENNLSETAFLVAQNDRYDLRWFTPRTEVDLCGHATLASAFVVFNYIRPSLTTVEFSTASGMLRVAKEGRLLSMDFPARPAAPCAAPESLLQALGQPPQEVRLSRDYLAVYASEDAIRSLTPNMDLLAQVECLGIIVTARGKDVDFVSRFFAPRAGVPEDPVTGSAHCTLVPYWSAKLDKNELHARQLSPRGGELFCRDLGSRIKIAGEAVLYMEGSIYL
ncbi:MAG: PhzF family phenazine biosynthesis protein [Desulfobacterales bacterium]|nr:MAG: PhzF family phenazine biosynthesis protein [Desulfobacterales bacterium]